MQTNKAELFAHAAYKGPKWAARITECSFRKSIFADRNFKFAAAVIVRECKSSEETLHLLLRIYI